MSATEERLRELGIELPPAKPPVANYLGTKRSGDLLFVSGRVSAERGEVGTDLPAEAAKRAARETMIVLLSIIKDAIGDLDEVVSIEKLNGFVRSAAHFTEQPFVVDGASEVLISLWGEAGRHARTATGVAQLPFGAAVQLELIARLRPRI